MIQIKLIGMSMISYYTKVHLCNGSWVVSTEQTMNFNIQTAAMFVFLVFDKNGLIKSCSSFADLSVSIQNFMVPRWLVQVLHPPQKFERPPFWNGWKYVIKKNDVEVTFNGMTSLLNFIKNLQIGSKVIRGGHTDRRTDRQKDWWSHKPHFPF
jgi:hypothetical protein